MLVTSHIHGFSFRVVAHSLSRYPSNFVKSGAQNIMKILDNFAQHRKECTLIGLIFARLNFARSKTREIFRIYFREWLFRKILRGFIFVVGRNFNEKKSTL